MLGKEMCCDLEYAVAGNAQMLDPHQPIGSDVPIIRYFVPADGRADQPDRTGSAPVRWGIGHRFRRSRCHTGLVTAAPDHHSPATAQPREQVDHAVHGHAKTPPATPGAAEPHVIEDWAELFQALSDANRLRILLAVHYTPGICVTDLADAVGMSANATSHALAALRVRGIVRSTRSGRERRWSIASEQIHALLHQVGATHSPLHPEH